MSLTLPFKEGIKQIIFKNLPTRLAKRCEVRMDSEIWIPKMDEDVFNAKKSGTESCHVLFDDEYIFEIPHNLDKQRAELWFLWAFRDAIKDGRINVNEKQDRMTNKEARLAKRKKDKKRKRDIVELIKESRANPMSRAEIDHTMKENAKKQAKAIEEVNKPEETIIN